MPSEEQNTKRFDLILIQEKILIESKKCINKDGKDYLFS